MRLGAFSHNEGRDLERQAAVVGGIGEGHRAIVVGSGFVGQQGDVVDPATALLTLPLHFPLKLRIPDLEVLNE